MYQKTSNLKRNQYLTKQIIHKNLGLSEFKIFGFEN